jgi:photosystem II stability/assembly factor-like uncharacterized protein
VGKISISNKSLYFCRERRLQFLAFLQKSIFFSLILALVNLSPLASAQGGEQQQKQVIDFASALRGLEFREIGPAIMGGRVDDFAVVESNPKIVYAGLASGGVWKTINAGTTWEPLFDNEAVSTIGAVVVAPSDPSIVWVGTGEPNNRQSSSWGNGVYKSTDAGLTWRHMGLSDTHHIGSIVIHPNNPDIVYVAALGKLWGPNRERGVFKSVDGGMTWQHVLFINEDTGAVDLVIDPLSPGTLLAAVYQRRRTAYGFNGSGPHSAIYKTIDGGATWKKLVKGLPYENEKDSETGRIGLNIYRRNPSIIYAIVEHARGGIFRSEDKGETWRKMSETNPRPMYFGKLRIDPNNDLRIWVMDKPMYYSEDGGRTFTIPPVRRIHGDFHAMWINPEDSSHMILGSDGGISWSWDAGKTWDVVNNIAIGQFYEVAFDMQKPYFIYGGLQDNGTWGGPSQTLFTKGITNITNDDWFRVGGGDGFYVQVDPTDPNIVYAETQDGTLFRRNLRTYESRSIRPRKSEDDPSFRFQWNSPMVISSRDPKTIYCGAQFLFKSTDRGDTWIKISPDLTTGVDRNTLPIMGKIPDAKTRSRNDGVLQWPCITTIGDSSINPDVIWVGTDDGNLQITRDGGKTWRNVSGLIPGLPERTYVSRVIASRHAEGTAYAAFDGHRMNDFEIYAYTTTNFGQTWRSITKGIPRNNGIVHVIREHHRNPDLLFAGTEYGAYVSFDRGADWAPLKLNLPTVPVDDIAIHPRENDLIFGTHGRSIWILDDITPLEELNKDLLARDLCLFNLRPATAWRIHTQEAAPGYKIFNGPNPPYGAIVTYYLKPRPDISKKIGIRVEDASGKKIREFDGPANPGINRTAWDLRYGPPAELTEGQILGLSAQDLSGGPMVEPGTYLITVFAGEERSSKNVLVEEDPRITIAPVDRAARHNAIMRTYELSGTALLSLQKISRLRESLNKTLEFWRRPGAPAIPDEIQKKAIEFSKNVNELLVRRLPAITRRLGRLGSDLEGYTAAPIPAQMEELESVAALVKETAAAIEKLIETDLVELNLKMNQAGIPHDECPR